MPLMLKRSPQVDPHSYTLFCGPSKFAWIKILGGGGQDHGKWSWHCQWHLDGIERAIKSEPQDGYASPEEAAAAAAKAFRRALHALNLMEIDPPKI